MEEQVNIIVCLGDKTARSVDGRIVIIKKQKQLKTWLLRLVWIHKSLLPVLK